MNFNDFCFRSKFHLHCSISVLTSFPFDSREVSGPEQRRYDPWVRLSNHVLEKLRDPQIANRLTKSGLPELKKVDRSTVIFQRNDPTAIKGQHIGIDRRYVPATLRKPDVLALSIAAAVETTGRASPDADHFQKYHWRHGN